MPKYKIVSLVETCGGCPSQWDGRTSDGRYVYIRYRWGYLSVSVANVEVFGKEVGGSMRGVMDFDELRTHLELSEMFDMPDHASYRREEEP